MGIVKALFDIRKGERRKTAGMFLWFFIIIAAYWFLKPLRSALVLEQLGADSIRQLKVLTAFVSAGVVAAYSIALTRFSREKLSYLILGSFIWTLAFFWFFFAFFGVVKVVYYCFYIFLDLFITVNVAIFWTFLADITNSNSAKRLYGLIGAGGVIGGFVGSFTCKQVLAALRSEEGGEAHMILVVAIAYSTILVIVYLVSRNVRHRTGIGTGVIASPGKSKLHDALEGAREVFASRYFLGVCCIMASYEFISTVNDFTFHKAVEMVYAESGGSQSVLGVVLAALKSVSGIDVAAWLDRVFGVAIGGAGPFMSKKAFYSSFFPEFFLAMNLVALVVQVLLTSLVIRAVGMTAALLVLPAALVGISTGFFFFPVLMLAQTLYLFDNALNYSINQTSREMLFVPVPRKAKYRALAFIDMFVLRTAKASAGFLLLLLPLVVTTKTSADLKWYMLFTVPLGLAWMVVTVYLGRRFHALSDKEEA